MEEQTLKAADNAALANDLLAKATAEVEEETTSKIVAPKDVLVDLPGGLVLGGEVIKTVEVRELTGKDEEVIVRNTTSGRMFASILSRGTVMLGDKAPTEDLLDRLLIGDREAILLGIYRATFGETADVGAWCDGCNDIKTVTVEVASDIKNKILTDPVNDSVFEVKGKNHEFVVTLPTGVTQKRLLANPDATTAESVTILLEQTVLRIDGRPVLSKTQVQDLGLADRRAITEEIGKRTPGPQFDDLTVTCPDCESEVQVPISLGTLFRI
jgi:hypothetical protein